MASQFPPQTQLILPLLEVLHEAGGQSTPQDAAEALADKVGIPQDARAARATTGRAAGAPLWYRHVRWVRQRAVFRDLIAKTATPVWELTDRGERALETCRPGIVITVYETEHGAALWAECEAAACYLEEGIVNLILTSPPYPLLRKKDYGNLPVSEWLDWLLRCAETWKRPLAEDGSVVINLGDVWEPGQPAVAPYQEEFVTRMVRELGYVLAQRFAWENPAKMPSPAEWVTVRRVRVTPSLEQLYWFSKTPNPKADNRHVLRPYSASMRRVLASGGEPAQNRPSGHARRDGAFSVDHGGSIPHNLIVVPNTASNDAYTRACKEAGLPVHPARFPASLPEFFIRFLTTEDDIVWDPFGGSGTTAEVCERLGRHWVLTEKRLAYLRGAAFRVQTALGFTPHLDTLAAT